jgi:hypothetical protein
LYLLQYSIDLYILTAVCMPAVRKRIPYFICSSLGKIFTETGCSTLHWEKLIYIPHRQAVPRSSEIGCYAFHRLRRSTFPRYRLFSRDCSIFHSDGHSIFHIRHSPDKDYSIFYRVRCSACHRERLSTFPRERLFLFHRDRGCFIAHRDRLFHFLQRQANPHSTKTGAVSYSTVTGSSIL